MTAPYIMAITERVNIAGVIAVAASGKRGIENLRKPYAPIFISTAARITLPAVGASVCASGSHVCTGNIGTLTANAAKNAQKSQSCNLYGYVLVISSRMLKVLP